MDPDGPSTYCSYTKAIEHLGDRWLLLIVRQLGVFGPTGFNDLSRALPGRISRSVLAQRLKRLETLGVVARDESSRYRLTAVGTGLLPVLGQLETWSRSWLPDDPAMVEREPAVVLGWLGQRVDGAQLPDEPVVLELWPHEHPGRYWLVLQAGLAAYGCLTDPMLDPGRYVYVRCAVSTLLGLARGRLDWGEVLAEGSLTADGAGDLCRRLPAWFVSAKP